MCGEKALSTFSSRKNSGSPPRMRGKVQPDADGCRPPRITPAYAGKSLLFRQFLPGRWDHPRVCGEKYTRSALRACIIGSPPRMRGKDLHREERARCGGITPAYAGKSRGQSRNCTNTEDHPRVCGEKARRRARTHARIGSPPRMRGKGSKGIKKPDISGITPAYAGKSSALCLG